MYISIVHYANILNQTHEFTIECKYPVDINTGAVLFKEEVRILRLPHNATKEQISMDISVAIKEVIDKVMQVEPVVKKDIYDEMGEIIANRFNQAQERIDRMFMEAKLSLYTYVNEVRRQNNLTFYHALEQDRRGNISKMWEVNPKLLEVWGKNEPERSTIYKHVEADWTTPFLSIPEIKRPVVWIDKYKRIPNFELPPAKNDLEYHTEFPKDWDIPNPWNDVKYIDRIGWCKIIPGTNPPQYELISAQEVFTAPYKDWGLSDIPTMLEPQEIPEDKQLPYPPTSFGKKILSLFHKTRKKT